MATQIICDRCGDVMHEGSIVRVLVREPGIPDKEMEICGDCAADTVRRLNTKPVRVRAYAGSPK